MLVVVGGHTRNIGKTSVICSIIRAFPQQRWTAIKITQYGHGVCSTDGSDCGCAVPDHPYAINKELDPSQGTDTSRYLAAGAGRSYWARTAQGCLAEVIAPLRFLWDAPGYTIVESNSVLQFVKPDLYLSVLDFRNPDFKPSSLRYLDRADALIAVSDSPPAWQGVAESLWRNKPLFRVDPPEYFSPELKAFLDPPLQPANN